MTEQGECEGRKYGCPGLSEEERCAQENKIFWDKLNDLTNAFFTLRTDAIFTNNIRVKRNKVSQIIEVLVIWIPQKVEAFFFKRAFRRKVVSLFSIMQDILTTCPELDNLEIKILAKFFEVLVDMYAQPLNAGTRMERFHKEMSVFYAESLTKIGSSCKYFWGGAGI